MDAHTRSSYFNITTNVKYGGIIFLHFVCIDCLLNKMVVLLLSPTSVVFTDAFIYVESLITSHCINLLLC